MSNWNPNLGTVLRALIHGFIRREPNNRNPADAFAIADEAWKELGFDKLFDEVSEDGERLPHGKIGYARDLCKEALLFMAFTMNGAPNPHSIFAEWLEQLRDHRSNLFALVRETEFPF